jgi:hypothetical protein
VPRRKKGAAARPLTRRGRRDEDLGRRERPFQPDGEQSTAAESLSSQRPDTSSRWIPRGSKWPAATTRCATSFEEMLMGSKGCQLQPSVRRSRPEGVANDLPAQPRDEGRTPWRKKARRPGSPGPRSTSAQGPRRISIGTLGPCELLCRAYTEDLIVIRQVRARKPTLRAPGPCRAALLRLRPARAHRNSPLARKSTEAERFVRNRERRAADETCRDVTARNHASGKDRHV